MPNTTWDGGSNQVVVCVDEEWAYVDVADGSDLDAGYANRVLGLYGFELMDPDECSPDDIYPSLDTYLSRGRCAVRYWAARIDGGSE